MGKAIRWKDFNIHTFAWWFTHRRMMYRYTPTTDFYETFSQCVFTFFLSHSLSTFSDAERKSLYALFLESVQTRLRRGEDSPTDTVTEQQATKRSLIKMQSIVARHLELDDIHDPLLAINFARWSSNAVLPCLSVSKMNQLLPTNPIGEFGMAVM